MSDTDRDPVVNIPSLEEFEKMVLESLRQDASSISPHETNSYSWEDFIDN